MMEPRKLALWSLMIVDFVVGIVTGRMTGPVQDSEVSSHEVAPCTQAGASEAKRLSREAPATSTDSHPALEIRQLRERLEQVEAQRDLLTSLVQVRVPSFQELPAAALPERVLALDEALQDVISATAEDAVYLGVDCDEAPCLIGWLVASASEGAEVRANVEHELRRQLQFSAASTLGAYLPDGRAAGWVVVLPSTLDSDTAHRLIEAARTRVDAAVDQLTATEQAP